MSGFKDDDFKDRLTAAAKAKQAVLEKFRAKTAADDPAAAEKAAARKAISDARYAARKARQR